ncbi:MAG: hypothetical protein IPI46_10615 [Bacteroidetes bacterium]|nr:hypothetical protein [Bacteroidota bacterium]
MSRIALLLILAATLSIASCTKTGPAKACFTFSKESPKVNDTLYLLNCSENYEKLVWINSSGGFYPGGATIDSVNRHQKIVVTGTGNYTVILAVGDHTITDGNYSTKANFISKTITVSP